MEDKYYLEIIDKNNFGFIKGDTEELQGLGTLVEISINDYNQFHELNSKGKQFRLKANPIGNTLFDYIEEYTLECIPCEPTEEELLKEEVLNQSEMMLDMDYRMTSLELGL